MMSNPFLTAALKKSAVLLGKNVRILHLVMQLGNRIRRTDWKTINHRDVKEKLMVIGRFATSYAVGAYRSVSSKTVLMVLAAIIYFVNPLDLIPDLMPVAGLTDDVAVLLWVYKALGSEIDKFIAWEKTQPS
jgi:uncharacterized membrane protein YkvA (DUF1232 family)